MKSRNAITVTCAALVALAFGCSDEHGPSGGGTTPSTTSTGTPPSGQPRDLARLCEPLPQRGHEVEAYTFAGEAPTGIGGMIAPGTYRLVEVREYRPVLQSLPADEEAQHQANAPKPTGRATRATLYVTRDGLRFNEARGGVAALPKDTTRGFTYRASGATIDLTPACPSTGAPSKVGFSASGAWLTLYFEDKHAEVYTRAM